MKLGTASTRRAIDRWKSRSRANAARFHSWAPALVARLLVASRLGNLVLVPPLFLVLSLNFAAIELAILVFTAFFVAKLHCYRFVNLMISLASAP